MKKITLLLFFVLCIGQMVMAQIPEEQPNFGTTLEEYNYITKGLKIQIETGLDAKKGYSFKKYPHTHSAENVKFEVYFLYRQNQNKPCATFIRAMYTIAGFTTQNKDLFFCLPNFQADKNIWDLYAKSLNDNKNIAFQMAWITSKLYAYQVD